MVRYGFQIVWSTEPGSPGRSWSLERVETSDCDSTEEACALALLAAIRMGWTPPRWWQWWRWWETRIPFETVAKVILWLDEARKAEQVGPYRDAGEGI